MSSKAPSIALCDCESSQIKGYGYDPDSKTLAVKFKSGGLYHYNNVPAETYEAMKGAKSVGSFLGSAIKGTYGFTNMGESNE